MTRADPYEDILENLGRAAGNGHARGDDARRGAEHPPAEPVVPIRFAEKAGKSPPPRRFIVDQWLPAGCVTSLYGPGGVGKSMLAQQAGTAVATGRPLFGNPVEHGPVLGIMAEDDDDELWRRQVRVNEWCLCGMEDLDDLHIQGRGGLENTLALYPASGAPMAGPLYEAVRQAAAEIRPVLLIVDPIAQLFGGNENDRFQVSHFVNLVGGLAREFDCAVLLLGHPAEAEGSEYSGSTAWNASVRSRLLLQRTEGKEDTLTLSRVKSNYAKPDCLELVWAGGVLRPTVGEHMTFADRIDAEARAGAVRTAFLDALDKLAGQGRNVSHNGRAGNYAPRVMAEAGLADGLSQADLAGAMNHLLKEGAVLANRKVGVGPDRHPVRGLARPQASEPDDG